MQRVGEGGGVARRDDEPAAVFADEVGEPAGVVVHHGDAGGEIVEELVRRRAPIERRDVLQHHQPAIERGGDRPELGLGHRREEEAVGQAELGGASREALLLLAVADEHELHAGVPATLELHGDVEQGVESVGGAMSSGETGDEVVRPDPGQGQAGALGRMEELEVGAVGNHRDRQTLVGAGPDALDDAGRKPDAGVGRTVAEEFQERHAAEDERVA